MAAKPLHVIPNRLLFVNISQKIAGGKWHFISLIQYIPTDLNDL